MTTVQEAQAPVAEGEEQVELGQEGALALAVSLHRKGEVKSAEALYLTILEEWPDNADAWHLLGMLHFQCDRESKGVEAVRQALELAPNFSDAHANLGNMLLNRGRITEAEHHLNRALILNKEALAPRIALSVLMRARNQLDQAETMLRPLLDSEAGSKIAAVHNSYANILSARGDLEGALKHYRLVYELDPALSLTQGRMGLMLAYLGRLDEAVTMFRQRLKHRPDDVTALHLLAACGGAPAPAQADPVYVKKTFDGFASSFESKLAFLDYRAPDLIAAALQRLAGSPRGALDIVDAGCGTGWLGKLIRPYCKTLDGVDLSPAMLDQARPAGHYDRLDEGELTAYLASKSGEYDVVTSADTLCYIGLLESVFAASHGALRPGGHLIFSVEHAVDLDEGEFKLQFHGRYAHRRAYIEQALAAAGFSDVQIVNETLRMENQKPVPGLIVTAQRAG